jgi:agmatine deiminase
MPVPAEWSPHKALWIGFPSHGDLWEEDLQSAQAEVAALVRALAGPGDERVKLLMDGPEAMAAAQALLVGVAGVTFVEGRFGDIWLRDTGPIFTGPGTASRFAFNGWGGKYELEGDDTVADQIAAHDGAVLTGFPFILEGGALDHDGRGTVVTTRQCLLNANRNPDWTEAAAEQALGTSLGAKKIIWLGDGLANDHTDGHVDNLARFIAPGVIACPVAYGADDPNADAYDTAARDLAQATDALGQRLKVVRIPSPGLLADEDGQAIPASHMNFLIANRAVVVPQYGTASEGLAVQALQSLFPDRTVIGLPSNAILTGGGSFHCISQQEPA